jgi:dTDP-4-dehydrorhamnose 3,5-epimerase
VTGNRVTDIEGVIVSKSERHIDNRGTFLRLSSSSNFGDSLTTVALSFNPNVGTVRGIHIQNEPYSEEKSISCVQGSIFDVLVDLRPNSKTFGKWSSYELTAENGIELYLPKGIAHGFQTLSPGSIVHYALTKNFSLEHSIAINPFGDLQILWPTEVSFVSERDLSGISFSMAAQKYAVSLRSI